MERDKVRDLNRGRRLQVHKGVGAMNRQDWKGELSHFPFSTKSSTDFTLYCLNLDNFVVSKP